MTQKKYILAFDTAMSACSCAIYDMELTTCKVKMSEPMQRGQAERLIPMIDEILSASKITYQNIALIACTHGPGAFTGLRLAISTAKALALSLDIPVIGVSTLQSVAATYAQNNNISDRSIFVCLETKRQDYYIQGFSKDLVPMSQPESADLQSVLAYLAHNGPWNLCGDALERLHQEQPDIADMTSINAPDPEVIARIGLELYKNLNQAPKIEPLYLRAPDVSFPKQ